GGRLGAGVTGQENAAVEGEVRREDHAAFVTRAGDAAVPQPLAGPGFRHPILDLGRRLFEQRQERIAGGLADPDAGGFEKLLIGLRRLVELGKQIEILRRARREDHERTDLLALERIMKLATLRDRDVNDLGDDVVFFLDRRGEVSLVQPLCLNRWIPYSDSSQGMCSQTCVTGISRSSSRKPEAWSASEWVSTTCSSETSAPKCFLRWATRV